MPSLRLSAISEFGKGDAIAIHLPMTPETVVALAGGRADRRGRRAPLSPGTARRD